MRSVTAPPKHLTLRNVPPAVMRALERERRQKNASLNQSAIAALARGLGVAREPAAENGIRELAGTWSEADLRGFEAATAVFEQTDDELWK
jgi:hypothetical protein